MSAKIIGFPDPTRPVEIPTPCIVIQTAMIVILPVVRIEQYDDAIAPVMGRPGRQRRLIEKMLDGGYR